MNRLREVSKEGLLLLDEYEKWLQNKELNDRTKLEYASDAKHFMGYHEHLTGGDSKAGRFFDFSDISAKEVENYQAAMKSLDDLKPSTINRRLSAVKLFFSWAVGCGYLKDNPGNGIKLLQIEKSEPRIITEEEFRRLMDVVGSTGNLRDASMIKLLIRTGIRVNELCGITLGDLLFGKNSMTIEVIHGDKRRAVKSSAAVRNMIRKYIFEFFGEDVLALLESDSPDTRDEIAGIAGTPLFQSEKTKGRMTDRAVRHMLKKYMEMAGISDMKASSFRQTFGMKNAGTKCTKKLSEHMGYSSSETVKKFVKRLSR